jgi:hypothetical protein
MLCATFFMMPKVASLVMANGALAALSATLGSQKEISWLRLSFENVTFESAQTPYAPGDDPWQIALASSEMAARIEAALAGHRFVPSGFEGLTGAYYEALASGSALPITTEDARRSLENHHRPLSFGGDRRGGGPPDRPRASEIRGLVTSAIRCLGRAGLRVQTERSNWVSGLTSSAPSEDSEIPRRRMLRATGKRGFPLSRGAKLRPRVV